MENINYWFYTNNASRKVTLNWTKFIDNDYDHRARTGVRFSTAINPIDELNFSISFISCTYAQF